MPPTDDLTYRSIAALLGCSEATAWRLVRDGKLAARTRCAVDALTASGFEVQRTRTPSRRTERSPKPARLNWRNRPRGKEAA